MVLPISCISVSATHKIAFDSKVVFGVVGLFVPTPTQPTLTFGVILPEPATTILRQADHRKMKNKENGARVEVETRS